MRVAALARYPVKACRAEALEAAECDLLGLIGDRRWAVLDTAGRTLTQREAPRLATIRARIEDGEPVLDLAGLAEVRGTACSAALSDFLGLAVRLASLPARARAAWVDVAPLLITSAASLAALNARLAVPVGMERFRANLVLEGAPPLAELAWHTLEAGMVRLESIGPCERCEVITLDQSSGEARSEAPLRTLAHDGMALFGAYFRVVRPGRLAVGEPAVASTS